MAAKQKDKGGRVGIIQENLSRALGITGRAIDNRPVQPVLSNVLITTEDDAVRLTASNIEMTISVVIGASVGQPIATTLPVKTLSELISTLSPGKIDLEYDPEKEAITVRVGKTHSLVRGISAEKFPVIPTIDNTAIKLPGSLISQMIDQVSYAVSKSITNPILGAIHFRIENNRLVMIAADGYVVAIRQAEIEVDLPDDAPIIMNIPGRSLTEVARLITPGEDVLIRSQANNLAIFNMGAITLTAQLMDGNYPNVLAMAPKSFATTAVVSLERLRQTFRRAEIFSREQGNTISISLNEDGMGVDAHSASGDSEDNIEIELEGQPLEVLMNVRSLLTTMGSIHSDQIMVRGNGPNSGVILMPKGNAEKPADDFMGIIMPVGTISTEKPASKTQEPVHEAVDDDRVEETSPSLDEVF